MNFQLRSVYGVMLLIALFVAVSAVTVSADPPTGWYAAGSDPKGYELSTDTAEKHGGKASGSLRDKDTQAGKFATMMQMFRVGEYRGKRVRMTGWVKTKGIEASAALWMRVDGEDHGGLAFDNMSDRAITGTSDWKKYEIVLDVPDDGVLIAFGVLMVGKGQVWVDDFKFETVDNTVPTTGMKTPPNDSKVKASDKILKEPTNLDFEKDGEEKK